MPVKKIRGYFRTVRVLPILLIPLMTWSFDFGSPPQEVFGTGNTNLEEFWAGIRLEDGRMLFAGEGDSVAIYDGWKWINQDIPGLGIVWVLKNDSQNKVWVGSSQEFGYLTINNDRISYKSLSQKFNINKESIGDVTQIFSAKNYTFFFADSHVFILKDDKIDIQEFSPTNKIYPFANERGVFCKSDEKIFEFQGTNFVLRSKIESNKDKEYFLSWQNENSEIEVLTKEGIEILGGSHSVKKWYFNEIGINNIVPANTSKKLGDKLIIPTSNNGLCLINLNDFSHETIVPWNYKDLKQVNNVVIEDEHFYWLITRRNLTRVMISKGSRLAHFTQGFPYQELLGSNYIRGDFFFCSNDGAYRINGEHAEQILEHTVFGIEDFEKSFLLTTPWDLIEIVDEREPEQILDNIATYSINVESPNSIWVTSRYDVRRLLKNDGNWIETKRFSGFTGAATQMVKDHAGCYWIATDMGSIRGFNPDFSKDDQKMEIIPVIAGEDYLNNYNKVGLFSIEEIPFIITPEWIFRWSENNQFDPILLPNAQNKSLNWEWIIPAFFPSKGSIWLLRKHLKLDGYQIGKISLNQNGKPQWVPTSVPNLGKLGVIRKIHSFKDKEGQEIVAITGTDGIDFLQPDQLPEVLPPTKPRLKLNPEESMSLVNDSQLPIFKEGEELVPSFEYYIPHFRSNEPMYFQTRLAGLQDNWSSPEQTTSTSFPGLRSGNYSFEVRTINCIGQISEVASLDFRVLPPWYRTTSAYIGYAFALIYIGSMAFYMRYRAVRRRAIELKKEVDRQTKELIIANRIKSDFVANMSHEIRNPINGIIGNVRLLQPGKPVDFEVQQSLSHSSGYLQRLVKNILDFSKIESGKLSITKTWFNASELRSTVSILFQNMVQKTNISLIVAYYGPENTEIYTDQSRIEQTLINLTSNAIRFTKKGSVRVGIHLQLLSENEAELRLCVKDSGSGIKPEDQDRIFKAFEQGPSASHMGTEEKGTGLGLAIVEDIVETLNGSKIFESEYGVGTSFSLRFPVQLRNTEPKVDNGVEQETRIEGRYLLIDDYVYNHSYFRGAMKNWGAEINVAADGSEAFQLLHTHTYDAIFLDWNLPDYSGPEIAKMIRRNSFPLNTKTPIIAQTAYSSVEQQATCMEAGMNEFIEKPIDQDKMLNKLMIVCPGKVTQVSNEDENRQSAKTEQDPSTRNEIDFDTAYTYATIHGRTVDEEVDVEVLQKFEKCCKLMGEFLSEGNLSLFEQVTHKAIGIVGIVYAPRTKAYLRSLNDAAKAQDPITIERLMKKLPRERDHFNQLIDAFLTFEREFGIVQKSRIAK